MEFKILTQELLFSLFREGKVKLNVDMAPGEEEPAFEPNIINSTVFIICLALQVSTFAVNHKVKLKRILFVLERVVR